ncbi:hypothetical protein TUN199_11841 [Pyrenophora tritici-repentis]|nr:hypothetical protein Alg130_11927 [Pyrenophora tritici-repentis]KAI0603987.1 hypothetical protein TUN205_11766 [Pyrenophora tritici-repentis]KAI0616171.1 hypothetical protein TUN199_11841 [Pyrenophora tritici-repentis]
MQGAQIKSAVDQTHQNGTPHTPLLSSSSKQAHAKKTAIPEKNTSLNVTPILRSGLLNKPRLSYDDRSLVQRSEMLALTPNASNISGTSNKEEDEHLDGEVNERGEGYGMGTRCKAVGTLGTHKTDDWSMAPDPPIF